MKQIAQNLLTAINAARPRLLLLNETEAALRPAPAKWSPKEVIGHLIDSAANNHQRFVRAQTGVTDLQPYLYAQDQWVGIQRYQDADWQTLVSLWFFYNSHLAHVMAQMKPEFLDIQLNVWDEPATLRFVAEDYVRHLQHHLAQIFK